MAQAPPLDRVKALLAALPEEDQKELRRYLGDILVTPDEAEAISIASLEVRTPATRTAPAKTIRYTYRQESVRCGKTGCWCRQGSVGHGPYTYKYWRDPETGKVRKEYVGKKDGAPRVSRPARRRPEAPSHGSIEESSSGRTSPA